MADRMLVVAAHIGDFVWRCGGSIAKYTAEGSAVKVIVMSDGLRGEANDYWRRDDACPEKAQDVRRSEGQKAAELLGLADIEFWGMDDYPIEIGRGTIERLAHSIRAYHPDFIVTHDMFDAFNEDHNLVSTAVRQANATASGAGFHDGNPVSPRQTPTFGYEPHMTEICRFNPSLYVDISDSFEKKCAAMKVFASQKHMYAAYVRKAELRAAEAENRGGRKGCRYAEAFVAFQPAAATGRFIW